MSSPQKYLQMSWYENRMNKNTFFILLLVVVVILIVVLLIAYWNQENNDDNNSSTGSESDQTSTITDSDTSSLDSTTKSSESCDKVVYEISGKEAAYNIQSRKENSVIDMDNSSYIETYAFDNEVEDKKKVKNDNLQEEDNGYFFNMLDNEEEKIPAFSDMEESNFSSMSNTSSSSCKKSKKKLSKNRPKRFRNV